MKTQRPEHRSQGKNRRLIFVISGPSGSGKTTLLKKLLKNKELKKRLVQSVSFTTRPKRQRERHKRDYFFITKAEFKRQRQAKKILEWTRYLGYHYATPKDFVDGQLKRGKHIILCLDLKGTLKIKRLYPKNTVAIFIMPPSLEALRHRIEGRCNKTHKEEIKQRLKLAQEELSASRNYDYCLVNKNLTSAVKELQDIILREIGNFSAS